MKDLYTFDASEKEALLTYDEVKEAYKAFFNELKISYLVAEAHSGDIGGEISHEFHFPSAKGEDVVLSCSKCDYLINEELAEDAGDARTQSQGNLMEKGSRDGLPLAQGAAETHLDHDKEPPGDGDDFLLNCKIWYGVTADRSTLVEAIVPRVMRVTNLSGTMSHWRETEACTNSIKRLVPGLDLSVERPLETFKQFSKGNNFKKGVFPEAAVRFLHRIVDHRVSEKDIQRYYQTDQQSKGPKRYMPKPSDNIQITLADTPAAIVKIAAGDPCPKCFEGAVQKTKAVELGHTFHLGTRYSKPLNAYIVPSPQQSILEATTNSDHSSPPTSCSPRTTDKTLLLGADEKSQPLKKRHLEMGCHGIGISRMIAAVADTLADSKGLNWPRVMAPFEVVIVSNEEHADQVSRVCNRLSNTGTEILTRTGAISEQPPDLIVDDRKQTISWKLKDADMIGYPVIVILGKRFGKERICEIQCRRLGITDDVHIEGLGVKVRELLRQL